MKRIFFLICFFSVVCAYAENALQLSTAQGHPGDTITLTLSMTNSDAVVAMQTMVPLQGQFQYVAGSCVLTARGSAHQVSATVLHDTLRIYSYSLSLAPYSGNSGALMSFKVVLGKEPATYSMPLCHSLLSSANGTSLSLSTSAGAVTILASKIALSTQSVNYGHIPIRSQYTQQVVVSNVGNEVLTLSDISFNDTTLSAENVVQTIAVGQSAGITLRYAPVVAGAITRQAFIHSDAHVGDSTIVILADPFSVNELRPLPASGETDSIVTVSLRMNNMDSIVGLQTKIVLPSALTYVPGSFQVSADRSNGHQASAGMSGDTLVMLITHLQNLPLHGGDGVVATFQLHLHGYGYYQLNLIQSVLSDAMEHNVLSAVYSNGVQIYSPSLNCSGTLDLGNTPVVDTANAALLVQNNGNSTMLINQVVFTDGDFMLETPLPMTIPSWQNAVLAVSYTGMQEGTHTATMNIYSNDPFHPLVQVALTASRYEPNSLKVTANENAAIANAAIDLELNNYSAITALQMDVEYPYQHYVMNEQDIHLTSRSNGHVVSAARQNDSTIRVLILSMQNQPFLGNNGSVAHINLHSVDSTDGQSYPLLLKNVISGGPDGIDRLNTYDSVVLIATCIIHDTIYMDGSDTIIIEVYDTSYVEVHDTTYIDVHDTTFIAIHDTTYVNVYVPVHDTIYVEILVPIHDTTYIEVHDTTYIDVPYLVHDTTYITMYDTSILWLYDTTYITLYDTIVYTIHDTTYVTLYDTIVEQLTWYSLQVASEDVNMGVASGSGQFPEGTIVEVAAIPLEGYRFLQWSDGDGQNPRGVMVNNDVFLTAQFTTTGVENHTHPTWYAYSDGKYIVVKGTEGQRVRIYDDIGKLIYVSTTASSIVQYPVSSSGTYLVQVGTGPARKVTVVR